MRKWSSERGKWLAQGHTTSKWKRLDSVPGLRLQCAIPPPTHERAIVERKMLGKSWIAPKAAPQSSKTEPVMKPVMWPDLPNRSGPLLYNKQPQKSVCKTTVMYSVHNHLIVDMGKYFKHALGSDGLTHTSSVSCQLASSSTGDWLV